MKEFNEEFRTRLYNTIKDIESGSLIEIVVLIKPQSGSYRDVALWAGIIFSFFIYSTLMFIPVNIDVYSIYFSTVLAFVVAYVLFSAFPLLESKFISAKRKRRNVELYARAIFQKAGIRFTSERVGTLFYISLFEKEVFILPDRGAKNAIPAQEWTKIEQEMQSVFNESDRAAAIIQKLSGFKTVFGQFLPPVENDINELPDNLDVSI
ncbi:MAG: TPM domain-containing protein [Bacteroidales bacterium]